ncbi:hypothetical protein DIPPA_21591 [Diplonema papillatum]|nr:hypothetical protein DIPPA_21591 [Diplonema papillatum]
MDSPIGEINPALVAVLAVWLLMLLAAIFSLWQSKYSLICLFTVPVGCLALVACALAPGEKQPAQIPMMSRTGNETVLRMATWRTHRASFHCGRGDTVSYTDKNRRN